MPTIDVESYEDDWEDDHAWQGKRPGGGLSVDAKARIAGYGIAQVVAVDRGRVTVLLDGEIVEAPHAGTMRGEKVVVGDLVRVRPPQRANDLPRIAERVPRETVLTRTPDDDLDEERVVVANADQVAVVLGADHLVGGVGFLDRVLVAASAGGLDALVVVNKVDLATSAAEVERIIGLYQAIGFDVVATSCVTGEGLPQLKEWLEGTWTAFTGHSGVGKSSLFNLLVPDADQQIGAIGSRGGRHTTVASLALRVPDLADTWLVDTPGVRSFGVGSVDADSLHRHYPELAHLGYAPHGEVGAPVPEELVGKITQERMDSYRRLSANLRGVSD